MRAAVLGSPIAHSLSPTMHRAAYTALGLDWTYEAVEVPAGGLAAFVDGLGDDWAGLSVTAPLKREAAERATSPSTLVAAMGVANTLVRRGSGWDAHNTDVPGAVAALVERGVVQLDRVRILGGGATAESLERSVRELGATSVELWVRDPTKVPGALPLGGEPTPVDLLISTIPDGAVDPEAHVASAGAVFEVVYDPWPTALQAAAFDAGLPVVSGLDLLAHQARIQVALMAGHDVAVDVLRDAALAHLGSES